MMWVGKGRAEMWDRKWMGIYVFRGYVGLWVCDLACE